MYLSRLAVSLEAFGNVTPNAFSVNCYGHIYINFQTNIIIQFCLRYLAVFFIFPFAILPCALAINISFSKIDPQSRPT